MGTGFIIFIKIKDIQLCLQKGYSFEIVLNGMYHEFILMKVYV